MRSFRCALNGGVTSTILLLPLLLLLCLQTVTSFSSQNIDRRGFIAATFVVGTAGATSPAHAAPATKADLEKYATQVKRASEQLEGVPRLIELEKWDAVRAILIEPPLADCWAKTNRPLLSRYAETLGDVGGDEFAALEAKEELVGHLRYLDMAVYNNNFNPITVEGKSGATKELIRSYYEDPLNEFKACKKYLDELLALLKEVN